jgi:hypothetical protein
MRYEKIVDAIVHGFFRYRNFPFSHVIAILATTVATAVRRLAKTSGWPK